MTWAEYYDKFYDWSESTQISRLSSVTNFGPADEICEIAAAFSDETIANRLIRKAIAAGVPFSCDHVSDLEGIVADELFLELTKTLGGNMTWEAFYDHFYDWKIPERRSNAMQQKQFGPSEEVTDIAIELQDKEAATRLIKNALAAGVRFSAEDIFQLDGVVFGRIIPDLAMTSSDVLTAEDLEDISHHLDDSEREQLLRKNGIRFTDEQLCRQEPVPERQKPRIGFFGTLLLGLSLFSGSSKPKKKHSGHCDGDCANSPPHYGYRYGRWYYGRHHHYGCQFGGNHGGGGLD